MINHSSLGKIARGAVLGLALAAFAGAQPGGGMRDGDPMDHGPGMMMSAKLMDELGLSPDQQSRLKDAHLAMQKRKIQLRSDKAVLELDLKNVLSSYPVNQGEAMKIGEKVADVDRKITLLKVEAWSRFLAGLTADQHRKMMDIQADLQEKRKAWREGFHKRHKADETAPKEDSAQ